MRRRQHKLQVSTFPFLAVLLCAMGSLILVLLIFDRRAQTAARARVAKKAADQQHDAEEALKARDRADQERRAAWLAQRDKTRADWDAEQTRVHDSLIAEQRQLQEHRADVVRQQADAAAALRAEEERAAELRRQVAAERNRLLADEKNLTTRKQEEARTGERRKQEKAGLAQAEADLINLEETVKAIKAAREREASTFSVVPYRGKHGDSRRPLYIECTGQGLIFHPDKLKVAFPLVPEVADQQTLSDCLTRARDEVLKRVAQQRAKSAPGTEATTGYLLFLVRPEGITTYNMTQAALRGQSIDFGYEFVEADWILDFPEDGQSATQPWMTVRADNPPSVGTPFPHTGPSGHASGTGPPGVAQRQGAGSNSGSTGSLNLSTVPGSMGLEPIARGNTAVGVPIAGGTANQGTGTGTGTGPGSGPPRYQAVVLAGPEGSATGSGLGSSATGAMNAPGAHGFVGNYGSGWAGQSPGSTGSGLAANGAFGNPAGSADGQGGQAGVNGPASGANAAGQAHANGTGVDGSTPGVANGGAAVPNTDGDMPRQAPVTIGPPTTRTPEVFARDVPTPASMQTGNPNDPSNQAKGPDSLIQAPPALAPLPGQSTRPAGSTVSAGNGGSANGGANPNGSGAQVAQAPPNQAGQPPGATGPGGTGVRGEPGTTGNSSGNSGASDGDSAGLSMPAPPLPLNPPPTPRKGPQTPRPVRLAGDKEWVLYVECRADAVVLHPSLRTFSAASLAQPQGRADLTRAAQMLLDRRQSTAAQLGEKIFKPQIRFLVWPDGQRIYHGVYPALDSLPAPKTMQLLSPDDDVSRMTTS